MTYKEFIEFTKNVQPPFYNGFTEEYIYKGRKLNDVSDSSYRTLAELKEDNVCYLFIGLLDSKMPQDYLCGLTTIAEYCFKDKRIKLYHVKLFKDTAYSGEDEYIIKCTELALDAPAKEISIKDLENHLKRCLKQYQECCKEMVRAKIKGICKDEI